MNIRKLCLIVGGPMIILGILGYRFGYFTSPKTVENTPPPTRAVTKERAPKRESPPILKIEKKETDDILPPSPNQTNNLKTEDVAPKTELSKITVNEVSEKPEFTLGRGDPFTYGSSQQDDFSQSTRSVNLGDIAIKGIIRIENDSSIAILCVNGEDRHYYVKKGSVIRVQRTSKGAAISGESYISVKDVRDDEVELVLQERPDRVIIVR